MAADSVFTKPVVLGSFRLSHPVVLAPLTRMRAVGECVPGPLAPEYYSQRATEGGLLITEATQVSQQGQGYPNTPGIYSDEQVAGWRKVTDAVHAKGALIVLQLWHVGRVSGSSYGQQAVAPSAIAAEGISYSKTFQPVPYEVPRELGIEEIPGVVEQYRRGALLAQRAGFDGVEVHGANGYLIDQFLHDGSNKRSDAYGGSFENRARFLREVLDSVLTVWPAGRVGLRLAPFGTFGTMFDTNKEALFEHVVREVDRYNLAYLHLVGPRADTEDEPSDADTKTPKLLRAAGYRGPVIIAGGLSAESAASALKDFAAAAAFGRRFISNPDLPLRLAKGYPLAAYDRSTFYGGTEKGYTDYPTYEASKQ